MSYLFNKIVQSDMNAPYDPTHTYINFRIVNNNPDGRPVPLLFNDLRSTSVIENACDYYVAVVKFHISTIGLPCIVPQIQLGQEDPNKTVYSFTMAWKTNQFQAFLEFEPENEAEPVPEAPITKQDVGSKYYFVTNYSYFIGLLNKTLKAAFDGLNALETLPTTNPPFILYDPISSQCIFNADQACFDTKAGGDPVYIYANPQMFNLLSGFEYINKGAAAQNGMNFQLNIYSNFGTNVLEQSSYDILQSYEEYESVTTWNPVQSIVLSSSTLPIEQTVENDIQQFNSLTAMSVNSTNVTAPILTDFTVAVDVDQRYIPSVDYTSPPQYRLVDMFGHGNVKNIQLQVYWKDIYGNTYPLELPCGGYSDMSLVFRKKSFNGL